MKLLIHSIFNICTIYIILWGLYGFHWYDSAKDTQIDAWSNIFLSICMVISVWCVLQLKGKLTKPFFRGFNVLLLVFIIYGVFYIILGDTHYVNGHAVNKGSYLIGILRSFLPFYSFCFFTLKGYVNQRSITLYFVILFVFSLLYDISFSLTELKGNDDYVTNNLGYVYVSFFPIIYIYKQKTLLQYILLSLIIGLTITSMKRGAIIISIILLIIFLYYSLSHVKLHKRYRIIFLSLVLLSIGYFYINYLFENSLHFQIRIEQTREGGSSGRDILYTKIIDHYWNESSIFQQLFGSGPDSVFDILGIEAHSDWLEILTSQGLFGVAVFVFFWFNCFIYWRRMPKNTVYYQIVGAVLLTQFLRSFFSMSYATIPTIATLFLGYSIAMNEMQTKTNNDIYKNTLPI